MNTRNPEKGFAIITKDGDTNSRNIKEDFAINAKDGGTAIISINQETCFFPKELTDRRKVSIFVVTWRQESQEIFALQSSTI